MVAVKRSRICTLLLWLVILTSACTPVAPLVSAVPVVPQVQATVSATGAVPLATVTSDPPPQNSVSPTAPVSAVMSGLQFPIRAAFYYPWFPEAWKQQGMNPFTHYQPGLGYYNQDDLSVVKMQIAAMQYGKIQAGIASWWGQGTPTAARFPSLLKLGEQMGFYWAVYVESEGTGNPSVDAIRADLEYIRDNYAGSPAYLKVGSRFVVFVYSDPGDGCDMASRWKQGNTVGAYLVLKNFAGYRKCSDQPDGWHQYAPAKAVAQSQSDSYTISPGFWKGTDANPRLQRNITQWASEIQSMIVSNAKFQLITTFNEWGEGTAVESAIEWASPSHYGIYLDALHNNGNLSQTFLTPEAGTALPPK
jgi:hypothetical protein